ncbi:type II secretion system minor pseudopilin GspI [Sulfitobacter profundi]|uniref:Type II secretion system protein I n=1 Tax=Sulfitobacter profundi TaxID=2679961 RepID=A0ABW1Z0U4_9RHOB
MRRQADAGFTLIEALVAMAVLALGAVSLLSASEGHTRRITDLSDRVAARWAAEYRLSELRAGCQRRPQHWKSMASTLTSP